MHDDLDRHESLIPAPGRVEARGDAPGHISLDADTTLDAGPGTEGVAGWLRAALGAATGLPFAPAGGDPAPRAGDPRGIRLRISPAIEEAYGPEGYRLSTDGSVDDVAVLVEGGSAAGVFWGAQTLRQLLGPDAYRKAPVGRVDRGGDLPCSPSPTAPASAGAGSCSTSHGTSCPRTTSCVSWT